MLLMLMLQMLMQYSATYRSISISIITKERVCVRRGAAGC
jgi:hypothetical protein